ncbi:TIGR04066 family peptide maturation system protein [Clostridium brassicae]|uniref:TIGR04066 family peptide maturation system protein n=1 Tax=Clostridium brassicae TaxID=2999072 RepID=A0ABT4DBF5_9CLOT|nr:TIGR04066 family peptide maturation system protein [Clostridium brassicae]MCY6958486.1 TIGR04066 family peptide maturation system protein [Clostridium brassicae]
MIKRKAILFPYNIDNYPLIRFKELLSQVDIINIDTRNNKFLLGKDFAELYMGESTGGLVQKVETNDYDILIIGDGNPLTNETYIYNKVENDAKSGKDIISLYILQDIQREELKRICKKYSVEIKFLDGQNANVAEIEIDNQKLYQMNVPIILITGITERTKKIDSVLVLKEEFEKKGYKVSVIGSKSYSELFGIHSFPQFMFDNILEEHKILYFNSLCKNIEYYERPDAFIIAIPGSLIPYNDMFTNHFGITAFEVGQAVPPDAVIVNIGYGEYDKNFFENISNMVKYKIGENPTCYVMSNSLVDINSSKEEGKMQYYNVDMYEIDKKIKLMNLTIDKPIFNGLRNSDLKNMSDTLLNLLESN